MSTASSTIEQVSGEAVRVLVAGPLGLATGMVALLLLLWLLQLLAGVSRQDRATFVLDSCRDCQAIDRAVDIGFAARRAITYAGFIAPPAVGRPAEAGTHQNAVIGAAGRTGRDYASPAVLTGTYVIHRFLLERAQVLLSR